MFVKNASGQMVVGRVSTEPETKTFQSGNSKTRFSVRYGEDPAHRDEQDRPKPLFLSVEAWGAVGRNAFLLSKGDFVIAAGRLESHEWQGKTYTSMVADAIWCDMDAIMRILSHGVGGGSTGGGSDSGAIPAPADPFAALEGDDGDLPF